MPVRDFLMDNTFALAVVNGDLAVAGGASIAANLQAVKQGIQVRVRLFLGEYFLDETVGVDWIGQILVKNPDPIVIRELIRTAIASTPDVVQVIGSDLIIRPDRSAAITYTARTRYSVDLVLGEITSS
jgi:hypothetical protein